MGLTAIVVIVTVTASFDSGHCVGLLCMCVCVCVCALEREREREREREPIGPGQGQCKRIKYDGR